MVSRRAAAALGVRALLAARRRSRCGAIRTSSTARTEPAKPPSRDAEQLHAARCRTQLGLTPDSAMPAYEDPAYYVLGEQKLPLNVSTRRQQARRPAERARSCACSSAASTSRWATSCRSASGSRPSAAAAGSPSAGAPGAASCSCPGRLAGGLPAAAGLAALGRRGRLSARPAARSVRRARRRCRERGVLHRSSASRHAAAGAARRRPAPSEIAGSVRTALAIEPRDGHLCVFMPPIDDARGLSPRWSPPSRRPRRQPSCRCTSKAIRRPTIRASTSSR